MRSVDIALTACCAETAATFAHLDAMAYPSSPGTVEERTYEVLNDPRCPVDRYFLSKVDGQVIGGFRILPLEMKVSEGDNGWIQVGGLGRLGLYPHLRRMGYHEGVMRLVLQRAHEQGDVLSLLYPSNFNVYRKYGYGIAARHVLYSVPPRAFPSDSGRENIRPATEADLTAINQIYENQIFTQLGLLKRPMRAWREYYLSRSTDEAYAHWIYDDEDGPSGYLSTWYEPTDKYYVQRLHVTEWFISSHAALRAFLGFFRAQSANIELVKLPTPVDSALETALREPVWPEDPDLAPWHQPIGKLCSTLMGRIVNLKAAIEARTYEADGSVNLIVEDWSLPTNSGYWMVRAHDRKGALTAAGEDSPDIRLDISVLSSIYCGALTTQQALMYGLLESSVEAAEILDRMLGSYRFMVWDYF